MYQLGALNCCVLSELEFKFYINNEDYYYCVICENSVI